MFMMMKTTIASMKLCGHPVSHTHTHTVLHSLSIIVNLQDFQLSSLFLLYLSPSLCLLKPHIYIGRFSLKGDSKKNKYDSGSLPRRMKLLPH